MPTPNPLKHNESNSAISFTSAIQIQTRKLGLTCDLKGISSKILYKVKYQIMRQCHLGPNYYGKKIPLKLNLIVFQLVLALGQHQGGTRITA